MKHRSLILILSFGWFLSFAQPSKQQLQLLDSTLIVLHQRALFNGVVSITQYGKPVFSKALGRVSATNNELLSTSSAFNLASLSKQFIATIVMQLKEKGQLTYDDKVKKYLPDFPYETITLRQLLTHTSGLPEYYDMAIRYTNTLDTLKNADVLSFLTFLKPPLNFEPNTQWEYSNTAYLVLTEVIEKITAKNILTVVNEQIIQPLKLKNTTLFYFDEGIIWPSHIQRTVGFERKNGKLIENDLNRFDGVIGDGNFYSSVEDLSIFYQAIIDYKLYKKATFDEAIQPVQLANGSTYPYGFGFKLDVANSKIYHTGSYNGFRNSVEIDIKKGTIVLVLSNNTNAVGRELVSSILKNQKVQIPSTQLIKNVRLVDGTGLSSRNDDVRILEDKIWEIGRLSAFENEEVIDGKQLVLSPGFIDSHSHHFGGLTHTPTALPAISQGITTIVIGQDGSSYAMDTLLKLIENKPISVNVASYTGHATLRKEVMGVKSLYRKATDAEVEKMKLLLADEMKKGSLGLNTGLEYESAFFSNREEVLELAKVAAQFGGRYMSHIRSEDINLDDAIDEIIEIGRQAKLPVQISHIKIAKKGNWGTSTQLLARIQQARAEGINLTADCYPYNYWHSTLRVLFPNRDYTNLKSAEFAVNQLFDPSQSVIVRFAPNKSYAGKTLSEISKMRKETEAETLMNLIAIAAEFEENNPDFDEGVEAIMAKAMDDADVSSFLKWPHTNVCSDGAFSGHPRGYGTFTRVLGKYVNELQLFPLETGIYKMTGLAAEHLGISNRGIIKEGNFADLVLFDPSKVKDNASIEQAKALSSGIEMVWVNGKIVFKNQQATEVFSGKLIKREIH